MLPIDCYIRDVEEVVAVGEDRAPCVAASECWLLCPDQSCPIAHRLAKDLCLLPGPFATRVPVGEGGNDDGGVTESPRSGAIAVYSERFLYACTRAGRRLRLEQGAQGIVVTAMAQLQTLLYRPPRSRHGIRNMRRLVVCVSGFRGSASDGGAGLRKDVEQAVRVSGACLLSTLHR